MSEIAKGTRHKPNGQRHLSRASLHTKTMEKQHSGIQKRILFERPLRIQEVNFSFTFCLCYSCTDTRLITSSYPYTEFILRECTNCFLWLLWRWLNLPIIQAIPETSKTMLTDGKQCSGNSLGGISKNLSFWRSRLRTEGGEYEFDVIFAQVLHCESTNNHSGVHRRGKSK